MDIPFPVLGCSRPLGWLLGKADLERLVGDVTPSHRHTTPAQSPSSIHAHHPFPKTASSSSDEGMGEDGTGTDLDSSLGHSARKQAAPNSFFSDKTHKTHFLALHRISSMVAKSSHVLIK